MKRSLTLKRETLTELSDAALSGVAGGNLTPWINTVDGCLPPRTGYSFPDCTVPTGGYACATLVC